MSLAGKKWREESLFFLGLNSATVVRNDDLENVIFDGFNRDFNFTGLSVRKGMLKSVANNVGDNCCEGTGVALDLNDVRRFDGEVMPRLFNIMPEA